MANKKEKKTLLIKANIGGKNKGDLISIEVDREGTPINRYWRDRVKDSEIDNCVEFVDEKEPEKKKSNKKEK